MLLIEWNRPCSVGIGEVKLGPGINQVKPFDWEKTLKKGYEKQIKAYQDSGDMVIHDAEKPSQAVISKTYDIDLLESWLEEAKGPLKGAVRNQIKSIKDEWKRREKAAM